MKLPVRVQVKNIISSRYEGHMRPASWEVRKEGLDVVVTEDSGEIRVFSDGGQNVPQVGWVILLTGGDSDRGYTWTLYGMPKTEASESDSQVAS